MVTVQSIVQRFIYSLSMECEREKKRKSEYNTEDNEILYKFYTTLKMELSRETQYYTSDHKRENEEKRGRRERGIKWYRNLKNIMITIFPSKQHYEINSKNAVEINIIRVHQTSIATWWFEKQQFIYWSYVFLSFTVKNFSIYDKRKTLRAENLQDGMNVTLITYDPKELGSQMKLYKFLQESW